MNRNDFDSYLSNRQYWVQEDSLRSLDYDMYFSVAKRYYCDAGCTVCYINKNLRETKGLNLYNNVEFKPELWENVFSYFGSVRTNDDYAYLSKFYPEAYEWYKAHPMELCVTDISLVRVLALKDLTIKKFADISISTTFIHQVGEERVISYLEKAAEYGIDKIKIIDCGHPNLGKVIDFIKRFQYNNCVHDDFRTNRTLLNNDWAEYQNTWVEHTDSKLIKINKEAIHLYNDRFYFSTDDASDIKVQPFHTITEDFNVKDFLCDMLKGKQNQYIEYEKLADNDKFKDYFRQTQSYKVNRDFNFIPHIMYYDKSPFFNRMVQDGWFKTNLGLYKPSDKLIPIMDNK